MAKLSKKSHSKSKKEASRHKKFNAKAHPRNKLGQFTKKSASAKRKKAKR